MSAAARPGEPIPLPGTGLADCVREPAAVARATSYVALDRDGLHAYLHEVVASVAAALRAEPFSTAPAYQLGADPPLVSVNLAAGQMRDPALVADVLGILAATGLPTRRLQLEVLETRSSIPATSR